MSMDDDARPAARLTVLSGPSGVGKDSVIELIRARSPWIKLSVSVTTRKMRDYETDGE
ncbi:MAG TPA: guanylate kinase, partial [Actinoplanes sp.]|nr:guanylate kinase [Actinoplanes sp.]